MDGQTQKTTTGDVRDPAELEAFLDFYLSALREEFCDYRALRFPRAALLAMRDPGGFELRRPCMHLVFPGEFESADHKDMFAELISKACVATSAFGVVCAMECWFATKEDGVTYNTPVRDMPTRKECVYVSVEHVAVPSYAYVAFITRDAAGVPTLGPFQRKDPIGLVGRFSHFLTPIKAASVN